MAAVMHFERTPYGFEWGAVKVTRMMDDEDKGWVVIGVETPRESLQVYVTKTGKVRVHGKNGEWAVREVAS